jgi:hypothetical protein
MEFSTKNYELLKVKKSASITEIKKSYHSLMKIHHPDKNNGNETEEFKNIQNAYKLLKELTPKKELEQIPVYKGRFRNESGNSVDSGDGRSHNFPAKIVANSPVAFRNRPKTNTSVDWLLQVFSTIVTLFPTYSNDEESNDIMYVITSNIEFDDTDELQNTIKLLIHQLANIECYTMVLDTILQIRKWDIISSNKCQKIQTILYQLLTIIKEKAKRKRITYVNKEHERFIKIEIGNMTYSLDAVQPKHFLSEINTYVYIINSTEKSV